MPNHTPPPTHPPAKPAKPPAQPAHPPTQPAHPPAPAPALAIAWTGPAEAAVSKMTPAECDDEDPHKWHEEKVRHFQKATPALASATKARIRAPAHKGGSDATEPEHITVSYKQGNKDIDSPKKGAWHVYTGR
ncbi:hypothetical protein C2E23DRAFT_823044 [Lenzites betulinus]|nr:hypothetical protein C2E23DRAFT_823044 [Lenzites betulinus]